MFSVLGFLAECCGAAKALAMNFVLFASGAVRPYWTVQNIFIFSLTVAWVLYLWETYVSYRQVRLGHFFLYLYLSAYYTSSITWLSSMICLSRSPNLQYKVCKETARIPAEVTAITDQETFTKARLYQLDKSKYGFCAGLWNQLETTVRYSRRT